MPGKVNPVIAEALIMAAGQAIGNDAAITLGGLLGSFQLNTMLPLIARNLLEQIQLLARGMQVFCDKLVRGLRPDEEHIASLNERSLSLATALAPHLGYDRAAEIAKQAHAEGKSVRQVCLEQGVLDEAELNELLDPRKQTGR